MASSRDKKTPPESPGEARGGRRKARDRAAPPPPPAGPEQPPPPPEAPPPEPPEAAPPQPPGAPSAGRRPRKPPAAPAGPPAEAPGTAPEAPGPAPEARPSEPPISEPYEVPTPEEAARDVEPWFDLEPLPPLDQIVPEHIAYIRTVVARFGVTPSHWREDLVQEVLLEAHRSRDSRLDVRALLFGITRHVVFRWIAKRNAERTAVALHPAPETVTERSAEDDWQEAQRREAVRAAIEEIPELFREVFLRVELEHKTMPEVARELGIPVNTGYTRLHIARTRFLESLHRMLARRRIQKKDLSIPVLLGALGTLERETGSDAAPHAPDPAPGVEPDPGAAPPARGPASAAPAAQAPASAGGPRIPLEPARLSGAAWFGGGAVAATAVVLGVWLARSPDPGPAATTATPEPALAPSSAGGAPPVTTEPPPPGGPAPGADAGGTSLRASAPIPVGPGALPSSAPPAEEEGAPAAAKHDGSSAEGLEARKVLALIRDGTLDEATDAVQQFQVRHPTSPYIRPMLQRLAHRMSPPADAGTGDGGP